MDQLSHKHIHSDTIFDYTNTASSKSQLTIIRKAISTYLLFLSKAAIFYFKHRWHSRPSFLSFSFQPRFHCPLNMHLNAQSKLRHHPICFISVQESRAPSRTPCRKVCRSNGDCRHGSGQKAWKGNREIYPHSYERRKFDNHLIIRKF